jgi:cell division protein FtsL
MEERVGVMTEFHTVRPIDNSRLVRHAAPNRVRELARLLVLGTLIAAGALFYAWQHFACIQLGYQLESLKSEQSQATELNQKLKLEVAGLRSPSRIDAIARNQLGLTVPVAAQIAPFDSPSEAVLAELHAGSAANIHAR